MTRPVVHVCDETRDAHVCERVYPLDTARTPFNVLVRHFSEISQGGLWLKPFRGLIPRMPGLPAIEIVLLSEDLQVVECICGQPENGISEVDIRVASALILPAATIAATEITAGDRIRICDAQTRVEWDCSNNEPRARGSRCHCFMGEAKEKEQGLSNPQVEAAISAVKAATQQGTVAVVAPEKRTLRERIFEWLTGYSADSERRHARRSRFPKLVAYYWTGGTPKAFSIGDIGPAGFYLFTADRWTLGTRLVMTIQHTDSDIDDPSGSITMPATVMRAGADGVGFAFVLSAAVNPRSGEVVPATDDSRERLKHFLERAMTPA